MAICKCKMCGGDLILNAADKIAQCEYCGTNQTVPTADDEQKMTLMNRANRLRMRGEFDKASGIYETVVAGFPQEAEAYWGLVLCQYGIEYVDDPATLTKKPTCHRASLVSVKKDPNYEQAVERADAMSRRLYEEEATEIDRLNAEILRIGKNETPYDIFICYKETDEAGLRTPDSVLAQDLYDALVKRGYKVFFARVTLEDKLGQQYEPYIFAALSSAKILIAIGTRSEYFEAVWVKNEWSRYLKLSAADRSRTLIPCYKDMDPYDMPDEFKMLQAQDLGKLGAMQDLLRGIGKLLPAPLGETATVGVTKNELSFADGAYAGQSLGGRPHGQGTRFYENGDRYEGSWYMGKKQGKGTMTYKDGKSWTGTWENGRPQNGRGEFRYTANGRAYTMIGAFENGALTGQGRILVGGVLSREGTFKAGKLHGKGVYYKNGKPACEGTWQDGKPLNAEGTYPYREDWSFTGVWKNGEPDGPGTFRNRKGETIEGDFTPGACCQMAVETFADGSNYIGPLKNGMPDGRGQLIDGAGNTIYEGDFLNGAYHGEGTLRFPNGNVYTGSFAEGRRAGQGTLTYPMGQTWTGEWQNDMPWKGFGMIRFDDENGNPTGKYYSGNVENGQTAGSGVMFFPDGSRYEGYFLHDQFSNGTMYSAQNTVIDTWVNGVNQRQARRDKLSKYTNAAMDFLNRF